MDEYEVEVIDYLRVIWKGKWIILACLVAALAVTAALMWTRPNEYQGTITYRLYESLSSLVAPAVTVESGTIDRSGSTPSDTQRLLCAIEAVDTSSLGEGLTLKMESNEARVSVTLTGAVSPDNLSEGLDRLTTHVHEQLTEQLGTEKSQASAESELKISQITRQRALLEDRMTTIASPDDPLLPYLAEKIVDLEALLAQEQVKFETLRETKTTDLFTLETVGQLTITKTGPNRKISLAVAGVLGLFFGVLLAFFIHYLMGVKEKEADGE